MRYTLYIGIAAAVVIPTAASFDLGRIGGNPDRYLSLIDLAVGDREYLEYSGRGDRWSETFERRREDRKLLGTLSNPSYVYNEIIIDSGYIHVYARLRTSGLVLIIFMLATPFFAWKDGRRGSHIWLCTTLMFVVAATTINQNSLTGMSVKCIVSFAISLNSVKRKRSTI